MDATGDRETICFIHAHFHFTVKKMQSQNNNDIRVLLCLQMLISLSLPTRIERSVSHGNCHKEHYWHPQ